MTDDGQRTAFIDDDSFKPAEKPSPQGVKIAAVGCAYKRYLPTGYKAGNDGSQSLGNDPVGVDQIEGFPTEQLHKTEQLSNQEEGDKQVGQGVRFQVVQNAAAVHGQCFHALQEIGKANYPEPRHLFFPKASRRSGR